MPWPFRRRATELVVPEAQPSPQPPAQRAARDSWATVTPLRPTVPRIAPLIGVRLQAQPEIATTRSLLARHHVAEHDVPAVHGVVRGLASVRPIGEPTDTEHAPHPSADAVPPTRRARAAQLLLKHPVLTRAIDTYVGEAREPDEPFRAPAWLRTTPPPEGSADHPAPSFLTQPAPTSVNEARSRRRNLGQSRRVGLGKAQLNHPTETEPAGSPQPRKGAPEAVRSADDTGPSRPDEPEEPEPPPQPPPPPSPPPVLPEPETAHVPPSVERRDPGTSPRPVYRVLGHPSTARLPDRPEQLAADLPAAPPGTMVPGDIADHFQRRFGTDVTQVPVHRGPEVSHRASALNARAFTARGAVYLPSEAGPIEGREARSLLAHELTHVVQQRTMTTVVHEHSADGASLENQARQSERDFGGDVRMVHPLPPALPQPAPAADPTPLMDPEDYADRIAEELVRRGLAHRDGATLVFGGSPVSDAVLVDSVQRASIDESEAKDELRDLFRAINSRKGDQIFEVESEAQALARFLASHDDIVPLDWSSFSSESELKYTLDDIAKEYNLWGQGNILTNDDVANLAEYLWSTKESTIFGDPGATDGDELFGKDRRLKTYEQWGREVGLGLAETWGGMLGFRFSRSDEREILGLDEEGPEDEESDKKERDTLFRDLAPSPQLRSGAGAARRRAAFGRPVPRAAADPEPEDDDADDTDDTPVLLRGPSRSPAGLDTDEDPFASGEQPGGPRRPRIGLGAALSGSAGTAARRRAPLDSSPFGLSSVAREKAEAEEAEREERRERRLRSGEQWGREVGLDLAETWGGMLGFRPSRATEREILALPAEEDTAEEKRDEPEDEDYSYGGLRGQGPVLRTSPNRVLSDTGRPQIDPEDIPSLELTNLIFSDINEKLHGEIGREMERRGGFDAFN